MASRRLASITPAANEVTRLATADITAVASVMVTNTSTTPAEVTIYLRPVEDIGSEDKRAYLAANLPINQGQVFETFRFAITVGDILEVSATTNAVNFSLNAVFDNQGGAQVILKDTPPLNPQVGDIWVNSATDNVSVWTGSNWNSIALAAPAGPQGPIGPTGPQGEQGLAVPSFNLKGAVGTESLLPEFGTLGTGNQGDGLAGLPDAYYVFDVNSVFIWTEIGWTSVGPIIGPKGEPAPAIDLQGTVLDIASLPPSASSTLNARPAYYVSNEDAFFAWDGSAWINIGPISGPAGVAGPEGPTGPTGPQAVSIALQGTVGLVTDLDALTPSANDAYYVRGDFIGQGVDSDSGIFVWTGDSWFKLDNFVGPTGPAGAVGPQGIPGADGGYVPVDTDVWQPVPATISEALDQLAQRIRAIESA